MLNKYLQLNYPMRHFEGLDTDKIIQFIDRKILFILFESLEEVCPKCKSKTWVMKFVLEDFSLERKDNFEVCYSCKKIYNYKPSESVTYSFTGNGWKEFKSLVKKNNAKMKRRKE